MRVVGCTCEPGAYADGAMRKKSTRKGRQQTWEKMAAESVRKEKYMSGWVELLVWVDREKILWPARSSSLLEVLEASSVQEQTDTRQGGNWKESVIKHSRLRRRNHHSFSHGQKDGLAQ